MEGLDEDPLDVQIDAMFERTDAKYFAIMNGVIERMRERPELDDFLERATQVLDEEEPRLESLKMALRGTVEVEEVPTDRICPDVQGRDV